MQTQAQLKHRKVLAKNILELVFSVTFDFNSLVTDLEKSRNELISRGLIFRGTDGSDECLTFTDPDGNWFQLTDPDHF